jgi:hypothetical protein
MAEYLAAQKEMHRLGRIHNLLNVLSLQNRFGPVDFMGLAEYLAKLDDAERAGHNPLKDELALEERDNCLEDLRRAKVILAEERRKGKFLYM